MAVQTHKLGFGNGTITEKGDGTASYRRAGDLTQLFRVRIADVTGFSVGRGSKTPERVQSEQLALIRRTLRILGNGTALVSVSVNRSAAAKIEAWFRAHPDFGGADMPQAHADAQASAPAALDGRLVADELTKLAGLRDAGVLTEDEFAAQKAKLLG